MWQQLGLVCRQLRLVLQQLGMGLELKLVMGLELKLVMGLEPSLVMGLGF
jgi:hypothetical protein